MRQKHLLLLSFLPLGLFAQKKDDISQFTQKKQEGFDINFKPTQLMPRYFVTTESKEGKWFREAFYLPEKTQAMEGWYLDEDCKIPDGKLTWYHPNKKLKSSGLYKNGKKHGTWVEYYNNGMMSDSMTYIDGHLLGGSFSWNRDGYVTDSAFYDGKGNGVMVPWYNKGPVYSTGHFINDTTRNGRWTYYHKNGQKMAIREYINGEQKSIACFSETGQQLEDCGERDAVYPGSWVRHLQKNLKADVPVRNRAPLGKYTVVVQFVIDSTGHVTEITPLTNFGYGMEEEVVRIMEKSPQWTPAHQFGRNVNSYKKQPVTFMVAY